MKYLWLYILIGVVLILVVWYLLKGKNTIPTSPYTVVGGVALLKNNKEGDKLTAVGTTSTFESSDVNSPVVSVYNSGEVVGTYDFYTTPFVGVTDSKTGKGAYVKNVNAL